MRKTPYGFTWFMGGLTIANALLGNEATAAAGLVIVYAEVTFAVPIRNAAAAAKKDV